MAEPSVSEVTEKAVRKGGILAKLYFDMQSERPEDLQSLMVDLINNRLLKAPGVIYCTGSIDEPIKLKDVYSTNAAVDVLFNDLGAMINVAFNFAPIGVDVIRPEGEFRIKTGELNAIMLGLSQISAEYSKYILTRVLSKGDLEKVNKELEVRDAMGARLIKHGSQQDGSDGKAPEEEPL